MSKNQTKYSSVMIIDDNEIDNFINQSMIEGCGFSSRVYINTGSKSALEFLKNMASTQGSIPEELIPKLIFLDINMPIMSGFQFLDEFSKLDKSFRKDTRVVMLTTSTSPAEHDQAKNHEMIEALLNKPLTEEMLSKL